MKDNSYDKSNLGLVVCFFDYLSCARFLNKPLYLKECLGFCGFGDFMRKCLRKYLFFILLIILAFAIFIPSKSVLAANEDVKQSIADLQTAVIDKINYDVDVTATAFAESKKLRNTTWWASIFGVVLAIIETAIDCAHHQLMIPKSELIG